MDIAESIINRAMSKNPFSQILEQDPDVQDTPSLQSAKNNVRIIILCVTTYSIYRLFSDFMDTILLGFLTGVAYRQLRSRFINMWKKTKESESEKKQAKNYFKIFLKFLLFFVVPWIRHYSKDNFSNPIITAQQFWLCFIRTTNPIVRVYQVFLFIQIVFDLFGEQIKKRFTFHEITQKYQKILRIIFAIITFISVVLLIVTFSLIIVRQSTRATDFVIRTLQNTYDCRLITNSQQQQCAQKFSGDFAVYFEKATNMINKTELSQCVKQIRTRYQQYIGVNFLDYEEQVCSIFQIVRQISPNIIQQLSLKETGMLFVNVLKYFISLLMYISNSIFSLTTFIAIFSVTISGFQMSSSKGLSEIFHQANLDMINDITNLIEATVLIALKHFQLGIVLFQIFRYTQVNLILSFILSIIAFIPLVSPFMLVFVISAFIFWYSNYLLTPLICFGIYFYMSGFIYEKHYSNISLNKVFTNLGVVFGIYQYGVSGIIYGPLLIIVFNCTCQVLFGRVNKQTEKKKKK